MLIIKTERRFPRFLLSLALTLLLSFYLLIAFSRFVIAEIADPLNRVETSILESALVRFPDSALLHERLAARLIAAPIDRPEGYEQYFNRALAHANKAVELSPASSDAHLMRSMALEQLGDVAGSESAMREATRLSPNNPDLQWRQINMLVRLDRLPEAFTEARRLVTRDVSQLPAVLSFFNDVVEGPPNWVDLVTGSSPREKITLVRFFLDTSNPDAALARFKSLSRPDLAALPEGVGMIDLAIEKKEFSVAAAMWAHLSGSDPVNVSSIRNPGFEAPITNHLAHFDWRLQSSKYARVGITSKDAHSDKRALLIIYQGLETTVLTDEVRQLLPVTPGSTYQISAFAKPQDLASHDSPRIVVLAATDSRKIAESNPVSHSRNGEWQSLSTVFTVPNDLSAVCLVVGQRPPFSYSRSSNGYLLFDDFSLKLIGEPALRP